VDWGNEYIGLLVEAVLDVVATERDQLSPAPSNVNGAQGRFFEGVCQSQELLIAVLDADAVLAETTD
jgi:purine-binding chemotaxis protein CheW